MTPSTEHSSADQNILGLLVDQEGQTLQTSSLHLSLFFERALSALWLA